MIRPTANVKLENFGRAGRIEWPCGVVRLHACTNLSYLPCILPNTPCLESNLNLIKVVRANIDPSVSQVHRYRGNYLGSLTCPGDANTARRLNSFKLEFFPRPGRIYRNRNFKNKINLELEFMNEYCGRRHVSRSTHEQNEV